MFHYNDQVPLTLVSGSGGSGCLSFHRTRKQSRGGPDGGDGGQGGGVFFCSSTEVKDLNFFKKKQTFKAESGQSGGAQLKKGKNGKDLEIFIPIGVLLLNEKKEILEDFDTVKKVLLLKGEQGGKGNAFFKSSLNQAPKQFQKGKKGKEKKVILEFKPLVDVALIGEVNTGKSTFFNKVTQAKSPVGAYPYTTLVPYIAQMSLKEKKSFLMDLPGLEKGASQKISQGLAFLRSLQRAKLLLHFIDSQHENPLASQKKIEKEILSFDKNHSQSSFQKLSQKKRWILLSKTEKVEKNKLEALVRKIKKTPRQKVFLISSHNNQGIKELLIAIEKEIKK